VELGTWTSPADFGGTRGALTPEWWDTENTQFGLLKVWKVTSSGSFVDGQKVSEVRIPDLNLDRERVIRVRIGVKEDAHNQGGINLFGRKFGNYPQDIIIRARYKLVSKRNGG
jgi:predicted transcriptional regulator